jgi:hypothetical protein
MTDDRVPIGGRLLEWQQALCDAPPERVPRELLAVALLLTSTLDWKTGCTNPGWARSRKTLWRRLGHSDKANGSTFDDNIRALEAAGYLKVTRRRGRGNCNLYTATLPQDVYIARYGEDSLPDIEGTPSAPAEKAADGPDGAAVAPAAGPTTVTAEEKAAAKDLMCDVEARLTMEDVARLRQSIGSAGKNLDTFPNVVRTLARHAWGPHRAKLVTALTSHPKYPGSAPYSGVTDYGRAFVKRLNDFDRTHRVEAPSETPRVDVTGLVAARCPDNTSSRPR